MSNPLGCPWGTLPYCAKPDSIQRNAGGAFGFRARWVCVHVGMNEMHARAENDSASIARVPKECCRHCKHCKHCKRCNGCKQPRSAADVVGSLSVASVARSAAAATHRASPSAGRLFPPGAALGWLFACIISARDETCRDVDHLNPRVRGHLRRLAHGLGGCASNARISCYAGTQAVLTGVLTGVL